MNINEIEKKWQIDPELLKNDSILFIIMTVILSYALPAVGWPLMFVLHLSSPDYPLYRSQILRLLANLLFRPNSIQPESLNEGGSTLIDGSFEKYPDYIQVINNRYGNSYRGLIIYTNAEPLESRFKSISTGLTFGIEDAKKLITWLDSISKIVPLIRQTIGLWVESNKDNLNKRWNEIPKNPDFDIADYITSKPFIVLSEVMGKDWSEACLRYLKTNYSSEDTYLSNEYDKPIIKSIISHVVLNGIITMSSHEIEELLLTDGFSNLNRQYISKILKENSLIKSKKRVRPPKEAPNAQVTQYEFDLEQIKKLKDQV